MVTAKKLQKQTQQKKPWVNENGQNLWVIQLTLKRLATDPWLKIIRNVRETDTNFLNFIPPAMQL